MRRAWRTGLLGCGDIAPRYVRSLMDADGIELVRAASRSLTSAGKIAQMFGGQAVTPEALLADDTLEALIILSPPQHHEAAISQAIARGLHVYCEKPFALNPANALELARLADEAGVMLAAAPAVHLGPSLNAARSMIDSGRLGPVIGGSATLVYPGPDLWHHNPDHLFVTGGGPLWDMGVYHLSALVFLLGPVVEVQAIGTSAFPSRTIRQGPRGGSVIPVAVPTHVAVLSRFACGTLVTMTFSFDGFGSRAPGIELFGTTGAIALGQPNDFVASLHLSTSFGKWEPVADNSGWDDRMWAIGPVEAMIAHAGGHEPRTSPRFAAHVIDVMTAIEGLCHEGSGASAHIKTTCRRPDPLADYHGLGWHTPAEATAGMRQ
jgi:predicted dehydrogenase